MSVIDKTIHIIYRLKDVSVSHGDEIAERNHIEVFWDVTTFG
jgi:hypothetical protein